MQFTDSHIHLQDYKTNNAHQIIIDLQAKGFVKVVCMSSKPSDWYEVAALANTYPDMIIPAFGLHPWHLSEAPQNWSDILSEYLSRFPRSWVGECGLDRLKAPSESGQEKAFLVQAELAKELKRPLSIHALKAEDWLARLWRYMPAKFMLHSFGGSVNFLQKALDNGAYISLSASILKRKNGAEIINNIPLNRLLLESDAPYLSEYSDITFLAKDIAAKRGIDEVALVNQVYANFKEFSRG